MTRTPVPAPDQPTTAAPALAAITGATNLPVAIDVDLLRPHPANPRRDLGDLTELRDSIHAHGVRQNLLVVPDPDEAGAYRLVIGHRRTAAARLAGVRQLVAVVDETLSEADQLALMLLENIQRSDLSAVEEADAYQGLLDLGLDEADIADRTGRSRATVKARLKLVALPEPARQAVHTHAATLTDAAALDEFTDAQVQERLAGLLGTTDFHHAVASERRRQKNLQVLKPWLEALEEGNATELTRDEWAVPDGLTKAFIVGPYTAESETATDALLQLERMGAGWAWRWYFNDLHVYRPLTLEEATAAAEREEQDAARRAARDAENQAWAARRAEQDAAQAALRELADVTAATRHDFLTDLIGRKLTNAETASVVRFAGFELLLGAWNDDVETVASDAASLLPWLNIDEDEIRARADDEEIDGDDALATDVMAAITALAPANQLLAALAAANEPVPAWRWHRGTTSPGDRGLLAWYALLEDLGYVPSEAERAHVHPTDVDGAAA